MPARSAKRQRTELPLPGIDPKHATFTAWVTERGIQIHEVEPAHLPGRGIGLVASKRISKGDKLVHVPTEAMMRPQSDLFGSLHLRGKKSGISPQAKLAATLVIMAKTDDSVYKACSAVWPTPEDFESSLFWYHTDINFEAWQEKLPLAIRTASSRLLQDFLRDLKSVKDLKHDALQSLTAASFVYFWTIANTRSFAWKPEGVKEGVMVMCPFLDYMNHCASGKGCRVSMREDGYTLTANRDYEPGEEILATYGAHSNDKLLVHYGFTMPGSADDSINLDSVIMPHLTDAQKDSLESVGYLGNYSLFSTSNDICFRTQVALRARCMTSNEWEYFMNSGDDIGEDKDEEMENDLASFIRETSSSREADREALQAVMRNAEKPTFSAAIDQLIQRCNQIDTVLESFCTEIQ